jgi:peroxiredoxin
MEDELAGRPVMIITVSGVMDAQVLVRWRQDGHAVGEVQLVRMPACQFVETEEDWLERDVMMGTV